MARITVEDCLENVENRFELVMVASKRARQIQTGGRDPLVPVENDKPTVLALREIAQNLVNPSILIDTAQEEAEDSVSAMEAAKEEAAASNPKNDISIEDAMDAELVPEETEANAADSADIDGESDEQ
tara:strand:- start:843 stop:1226 length:384 start_codon:yes stop_codon:yes gene_type:complete